MITHSHHAHRPPLGTWTVICPSRPGGHPHIVADLFTTPDGIQGYDGPHHEITGVEPMSYGDRARLRYLFGAAHPPVPSQFDVDDNQPRPPRPRVAGPVQNWVAAGNLLHENGRPGGIRTDQ